jgi:iron complex outermembrane receptor protein
MSRAFVGVVITAGLVFVVPDCFAQQAAQDGASAQAPAPQSDENGQLRIQTSVVVTATRSEADLDKTPLSASVITRRELDARPLQNVDQQLTLTEGVYVQRFQGFSATDSNVYLRGFNGSARTLVLLDGQPLNDAFSSSINWTGLPTGQIDRIEVARGPFSSLYGGNALGGVINIRTRPIDRRSFEATGEYGTYNSSRLTALYADRMGRFGLSIGGERFDTDGYNSRRFTATPSTGAGVPVTGVIPSLTTAGARTAIIGEGGLNWLTRSAARVKGDYQAGVSTIVSLQYLRMDYRYGYTDYRSYLRDAAGNVIDSGAVVYDDGGTVRRLSITPNNFLQGPGEQHSNFYSGAYQHAFTSGAALRIDAGLYHTPAFQFRQLGGGNTLTSGPGTLTDGNRRTTHVNAQYNRLVGRHALTFGGETRHQQAEHARIALLNWTDKDSRGDQTFFATGRNINQSAYVQDEIAVANNLLLVVGGRYDYWRGYDGVSDNFSPLAPRTAYPPSARHQWSGKAALGYTLPADWNVRLSAGNAFRNPNVFDLYAPDITSSGTIFVPNPELTPELVVSWEAGVRKRFGRWTSVDAAYYENHITDLIYRHTDFARDPTGNYRINMNAGQGRTRGVELAFRQALGGGLEFRSTYTRTDAVVTGNPSNPAIVGKRVTSVPDHMASGQLLGSRGKWTGSLAGRYTGRLFSTDTNTDVVKGVPGSYSPYFTMDTSVSYSLTSRVEPFVTSENLLNRRYYIFYLSPGRVVFGGLRVRL